MIKKILYYHYGHLSDKGVLVNGVPTDTISAPDGDSSWLWSVLHNLQIRGIETYGIVDRDKDLVEKHGIKAFESFSQQKRWKTYNNINFLGLNRVIDSEFPRDMDAILLYWRMKTKNNQLEKSDPEYSPDLEIQNKILDFYKDKNIKLIILDLDLQMTNEDEQQLIDFGYKDIKIFTQSLFPRSKIIPRETCYIPFDFDDMLQFETPIPNRAKLLVYVGNPYNRWNDINNNLVRVAKDNPGRVHLVGNWMKDQLKDFRDKNPGIVFHPRIGFNEFRQNIGPAIAVPLLATEDYKANGNMTMRILETLLFGSIPVGYSDFKGINTWLPKELIIKVDDPDSTNNILDNLAKMPWTKRNELRRTLVTKLKPMHDANVFVNKILK